MSSPKTQPLQNTASQQSQIGATADAHAEELYKQSQENIAPLVAKEKALASGDRNAALSASMPVISQISKGYQSAHDSIFNTVAPGAARDKALADLQVNKATGIAGEQAKQVQQAPEILANVGQGLGAFSLQELGGALSGFSGASSTQQSVLASQTAQQAAKLGVVGSLAGAAGTAASGGLSKGGAFGSDRRIKQRVRPLVSALKGVLRIPVFAFEYIPGRWPTGDRLGVMAQDVEVAFPQASGTDSDGIKYVQYDMLAAVALRAIQELNEKVEAQQKRIAELEAHDVMRDVTPDAIPDAMAVA